MLKKFKFLILGLIVCSSPVFSNDVAMVAELKGHAQAYLKGESWEIELAEMLAADTEINLQDEASFLKIIHLIEDKEYSIPGSSSAKILAKTIETLADSGHKLEVVSADLNLGASMQNQVGTTDAYRNKEQLLDSGNRSIEDRTSNRSGFMKPNMLPKAQDSDPVLPESDEFIASSDKAASVEYENESKQKSVKLDLEKKKKKKKKKKRVPGRSKFFWAIPRENFQDMSEAIELYKAELVKTGGSMKFKPCEKLDWVLVMVQMPTGVRVGKKLDIVLQIKKSFKNIPLMAMANKDFALNSILQLESKEYYEQAAGEWIRLFQNSKISKKALTQHLTRLKGKLK